MRLLVHAVSTILVLNKEMNIIKIKICTQGQNSADKQYLNEDIFPIVQDYYTTREQLKIVFFLNSRTQTQDGIG